jgi:hypothetical protein
MLPLQHITTLFPKYLFLLVKYSFPILKGHYVLGAHTTRSFSLLLSLLLLLLLLFILRVLLLLLLLLLLSPFIRLYNPFVGPWSLFQSNNLIQVGMTS